MKKKILLTAMGVLSMGLFLTACGSVTYNVIETDKKYEYELRAMSGATLDAGVVIDGKTDDSAYNGLRTLTLKKNYQGQTAAIEVTTFIGKNGLYLGAQVQESTKIYYNPTRDSAYNTGMEFYFGFGDGQARGQGIFEVDLSAGGQFSIRVMNKSTWSQFGYKYEEAPIYAMQIAEEDENGESHEWSAEAFIPYAVFGRTARPSDVYFTIAHNVPQDMNSLNRMHYNFAVRQAGYSYATELDPTSYPYICDRNGFRTEDIVYNVKGNGTVQEENGYDRAILNKTTSFTVKPAAGSTLKIFKVNGVDQTAELLNGSYSLICAGKIEIEAEFVEVNKLDSVTLSLRGIKNHASVAIPNGDLMLVDSDGKEKTGFTVTDGVATVTDVYTIAYDVIVGNDWRGQIFFESGKTAYDITLGYVFFGADLIDEAFVDYSGLTENSFTVTGAWRDHQPNVISLILPEDAGENFTLEMTVCLKRFTGASSRLSLAPSDAGNVYNIFNIGDWKIGAGDRRDLEQDGGEQASETATTVGELVRSQEGLQLKLTRAGNTVTVEMKLDGENWTTVETFSVSGNAQMQLLIGGGTWAFQNVTLAKNN